MLNKANALIRSWCCLGVVALLWTGAVPPAHSRHAESSAQSAGINFKEGEKRLASKHYDGAVDSFLQAIYFSRNKYYPEAYLELARCYKEKHEDGKAIEAYKTHVSQATAQVPQAHLELGLVYMRNNRELEAAAEFNQALIDAAREKDRAPAYNALGLLAQKRNDYVEAEQYFINALGIKPWHYTEAWLNYSENLMKQQKWVQAIGNLDEMLQPASKLKGLDESKVYLDLGLCMMTRGNHQGALEDWRNCVAIAPEWSLPHLFLGQMFDQENHISSAINEYRAYLRLAPKGDKDIQNIKDRLTELEQKIAPRKASPAVPDVESETGPSDEQKASPAPTLVNPDSGF